MPQDAATQVVGRLALFIDIDGVLREFAESPQAYPPSTLQVLLSSLRAKLDGALALISGQRIAEVDALFAPYRFCCSGVHGCETRDASGNLWTYPIEARSFDSARAIVLQLIERHPGLRLQETACALTLCFEHEPDLRVVARTAMKSAADILGPSFRLRAGKCTYDIHPWTATHATAMAAFMEQAPFRGRTPVCIGDQATDEHAFALVNGFRGFAVRVGASCAERERHSMTSLLDAIRWLEEIPPVSPDSCNCGWNPGDL